ncbi:MAG: glycosyltransferase family 39 protein, partial [Bryobacterales bacterium]|nr:glycosyltransferase family 39 protein [Bryobacterales bacterium]
MPNAKTKRIAVAAVLALGAALRLWGLGFGLPIVSNFYVRPDESLLVQAAVGFFERYGNPQFFAYPALLTELSAMLFLPLPGEFATEPSTYFLAVRVLSALAGIATVGVVYLLARGFCDWKWSLAAAALFAVAPLPVRDAHFGVTDTLLTLLVALTLLLATRPVRKEESGTGVWIWTSLVFGLAVSTKYTAVFAAPAIVAAAFARGGPLRRTARDLAAAGAIAAAVFFVLNPYVLLRMGEVAATILEMLRVFYGGTQALPESHWSWSGAAMQLLRPLLWGPGSWLGFALAAASLPWLRRASAPRGLWTLALGVFPFLLVFLPFRHPLP